MLTIEFVMWHGIGSNVDSAGLVSSNRSTCNKSSAPTLQHAQIQVTRERGNTVSECDATLPARSSFSAPTRRPLAAEPAPRAGFTRAGSHRAG